MKPTKSFIRTQPPLLRTTVFVREIKEGYQLSLESVGVFLYITLTIVLKTGPSRLCQDSSPSPNQMTRNIENLGFLGEVFGRVGYIVK